MSWEQIGPYKVVRKLGEGGMGAVFEAVHEAIEKRVAIKLLHPEYARTSEFAARFFNEARAVNRVDHPGLVQVNDYGQLPDGTAYIVMEYLRGETLGSRLKRTEGDIPLADSLRLLRQIAAALAAAHSKGIVHRDLKPDNIMMVPDPETLGGERAKLLDFGIAKLAEDKNDDKQVRTRTNQLIGTPRYMSPEQCKGAGGVDDRTDVYALGVILYQLLARRPPFIGSGSGELMAMHIYESPPPLDHIPAETPPQLVELTYRMLSKDKAERPSMQEMLVELENLSASPSRPAESAGSRPTSGASLGPGGRSGSELSGPRSRPSLKAVPALQSGSLSGSRTGDSELSPTVDVISTPLTPATLVAATGQQEGSASSAVASKSRLGLLLGAASALGVLALGLVLGLRAPQPGTPKGQPATPPPSGELVAGQAGSSRNIHWSIDSEPSGADVVRVSDGQLLGKTPWSREQPGAPGTMQVRIRYPGFAERRLTLEQNSDMQRRETLDALAAPASPPAIPVSTPGVAAGPHPIAKKRPPVAKPVKPSESKDAKIEIE